MNNTGNNTGYTDNTETRSNVSTMGAVITHAPGDYRFEQVPIPVPGDREILLKVEACGICAGDIKAFQGGKRFWGGGPFTQYIESGCIGGHEFIGHAAAVGKDLSGDYTVGDRLIAEQIVPCGNCGYCRKGLYWMCDPHEVFGFKKHLNGGFAEYMILPEKSIIHRVPDTLSLDQAALIEPLSCSLHAIDRAAIEPEDVVVVSGCGPLGLGMIIWAKLFYNVTVIALDLKEHRLHQAETAGADYALNPKKQDVGKLIALLNKGLGCDVYIEATGYPDSVYQGLQLIRKKGRLVEFSVFNDDVTCDFSIIGDAKELDIFGVSLSPHCYGRVIAALEAKQVDVSGLVTHTFPLSEFAAGFDTAVHDDKSIKVLLVPEAQNQ